MPRRGLLLLVLGVLAPVLVWAVNDSPWWNNRLEAGVRLLIQPDPRVVYRVETRAPVVALTIDDGPDAATTPAILDVLARHDARATFFLISDRVEGNERVVRRLVAEGHEIGNHMTADRPSIDLPPAVFERRLQQAHFILSRFQEPAWFRPGSGLYDDAMLERAARQGYRTALGRVYPLDAAVGSPGLASRFIRWASDPGDVIILHDAGERGRNTVETLERVLPALERRGVDVVTLSELSETAGPL